MVSLIKAEHYTKMIALALEAINQLQGTCQSMHDLGPEFEEAQNDATFCHQIDSEIFCCEECSWWFEMSEMANRKDEEWICSDCSDDDDLAED